VPEHRLRLDQACRGVPARRGHEAGESFVKFHKNDECFYGHIWLSQKAVYAERNGRGDYAERSAKILTDKKFNKDTEAYKAYITGKFPPAHIHAMARRYAVKHFLSDLQAVWHFVHFGKLQSLGSLKKVVMPISENRTMLRWCEVC
jgi:hypothetical protein